jgi:glycosyltransferase involved in cell wall biosynthesis
LFAHLAAPGLVRTVFPFRFAFPGKNENTSGAPKADTYSVGALGLRRDETPRTGQGGPRVHLVALVRRLDYVCCRYRLAAFQAALEQAGHSLTLVRLPKDLLSRWALFRRLNNANVILQRTLLPGWQLNFLRRRLKRLIFDFDDAVFLRDSFSGKGHGDARRMRRFTATVRACDAVVAGNDFLGDHAARWAGVQRVFVIPTCINPDLYLPKCAPGDGAELVWIGSSSTLQALDAAAPFLDELGRALPGMRLKVICDRFPRLRHLPVVECPWSGATEARELASSDIGVSWLPNDKWSRGKCGLKVLQYMAAGLPVVVNPVGVHLDMVRHGENGYLAETAEQWHAALANLRADADLRRRMGQAGRRFVETHYRIDRGSQLWLEALERLSGAWTPMPFEVGS